MDDGTLNQPFYTSQDGPLSPDKLPSNEPEPKISKNITTSKPTLPPTLSVSSSAEQAIDQSSHQIEDVLVSFELDITRVCVRNGAVRLPYSAKNLFDQKTDLVVRAAESRSEYVLSFIPPRILDNLEAFFADSNAKANDKLILKLHGNRGEIKLEKRQTTRRGRRDTVESKPTKHELLTAAAKAQPAQPLAEIATPEPIPEMPLVAPGTGFHPRANVGVGGSFNKLKTVVMRPKNKVQHLVSAQPAQVVQDEPAPVTPPARRAPPEAPKPNPVLRDTAPARYRVEPESTETIPKPDTAASSGGVSTFPTETATFDPLANNAYVAPERYDMSDGVGETFRRTVPSGFAPVGGDDIPPMPTDVELKADAPQVSPPSEILIQELQSHMSRPSTPAILRVDDVADVLGLKADRVQQALQALSEEEDASIRAIREGVFQILRRDMTSL